MSAPTHYFDIPQDTLPAFQRGNPPVPDAYYTYDPNGATQERHPTSWGPSEPRWPHMTQSAGMQTQQLPPWSVYSQPQQLPPWSAHSQPQQLPHWSTASNPQQLPDPQSGIASPWSAPYNAYQLPNVWSTRSQPQQLPNSWRYTPYDFGGDFPQHTAPNWTYQSFPPDGDAPGMFPAADAGNHRPSMLARASSDRSPPSYAASVPSLPASYAHPRAYGNHTSRASHTSHKSKTSSASHTPIGSHPHPLAPGIAVLDRSSRTARPNDWRPDFRPKRRKFSYRRLFSSSTTHLNRPRTLHALLQHHPTKTPPITYDLRNTPAPDTVYLPLQHRTAALPDLYQLAFSPPAHAVTLLHPRLPWLVHVRAGSPAGITILDVLEGLHRALHRRIHAADLYNDVLGGDDRDAISAAFTARCGGDRELYAKGVKRVDFMSDDVFFCGLAKRANGIWEVKTRPVPAPSDYDC
ncbi:hypothetical protein BD626DRAFT_495223 [Schizophyllum amplum]|uniref:DUF6699 domain-containing protein n=1 Tax=Schizophyllum amplum TaxID=97359 RepID=A0A550CG12_9AGAR|nr:hypothetical protein BD626DRAFT_495223 [Auriculariopsis ampla]